MHCLKEGHALVCLRDHRRPLGVASPRLLERGSPFIDCGRAIDIRREGGMQRAPSIHLTKQLFKRAEGTQVSLRLRGFTDYSFENH